MVLAQVVSFEQALFVSDNPFPANPEFVTIMH